MSQLSQPSAAQASIFDEDALLDSLSDVPFTIPNDPLPSEASYPLLPSDTLSDTYSVVPSANASYLLTQLGSPNPIPQEIEQVTLYYERRYRTYAIYNMTKDSELFLSWWLQTDYGRTNRIRWDAEQSSSSWQGFQQVAEADSGIPRVLCQSCQTIIKHPKCGGGLTTMGRHYKGPSCKTSREQKKIKKFTKPVTYPIYMLF